MGGLRVLALGFGRLIGPYGDKGIFSLLILVAVLGSRYLLFPCGVSYRNVGHMRPSDHQIFCAGRCRYPSSASNT